jgi:hypothetical protein
VPSTRRRAFLASLGSAAAFGLAGCSRLRSGEPPAGSLRFENDHDLPHAITVAVTDVGTDTGDDPGAVTGDPVVPPAQRSLTASASLDSGGSETYERVFTEPVWYVVEFTVDGRPPREDARATVYHPVPPGEETGRTLTGRVYKSGEFSWVVSGTENRGGFDG